jgi:hypothetical protein
VSLNAIQHGQNLSECKKRTGWLEMLELVMVRAREQMTHEMLKPAYESHTAQERNSLSIVLTEMSAGCPGGLEVSQNRTKIDPVISVVDITFTQQNGLPHILVVLNC